MASVSQAFLSDNFLDLSKIPMWKIHKKSTPKSCLNHEQIDVKVMLFCDVTFFRFWSPFGEVLESKMAAQIALWAPKCRGASPFEAFEIPWLSKMVSWEGPRSIFEPTGVDFGWFRLDFFKIWHCFWICFLTFSQTISNFHFLADHCFSHFDCPDVRSWSKQCLHSEQSSFDYFLGVKVYRGLKLCPTSPFIVKLRSQVGLGGSAKRKQFCAKNINYNNWADNWCENLLKNRFEHLSELFTLYLVGPVTIFLVNPTSIL